MTENQLNNTLAMSIDDFIEGMPITKYGKTVARRALNAINVTDVLQLQDISYRDINKLAKVGWKTLHAIEDRAAEIGIAFKERSYRYNG